MTRYFRNPGFFWRFYSQTKKRHELAIAIPSIYKSDFSLSWLALLWCSGHHKSVPLYKLIHAKIVQSQILLELHRMALAWMLLRMLDVVTHTVKPNARLNHKWKEKEGKKIPGLIFKWWNVSPLLHFFTGHECKYFKISFVWFYPSP